MIKSLLAEPWGVEPHADSLHYYVRGVGPAPAGKRLRHNPNVSSWIKLTTQQTACQQHFCVKQQTRKQAW